MRREDGKIKREGGDGLISVEGCILTNGAWDHIGLCKTAGVFAHWGVSKKDRMRIVYMALLMRLRIGCVWENGPNDRILENNSFASPVKHELFNSMFMSPAKIWHLPVNDTLVASSRGFRSSHLTRSLFPLTDGTFMSATPLFSDYSWPPHIPLAYSYRGVSWNGRLPFYVHTVQSVTHQISLFVIENEVSVKSGGLWRGHQKCSI